MERDFQEASADLLLLAVKACQTSATAEVKNELGKTEPLLLLAIENLASMGTSSDLWPPTTLRNASKWISEAKAKYEDHVQPAGAEMVMGESLEIEESLRQLAPAVQPAGTTPTFSFELAPSLSPSASVSETKQEILRSVERSDWWIVRASMFLATIGV